MGNHLLTNQGSVTNTPVTFSLKPGQLMQGKVLKLYPGQHALIQFGGQTINARLKASLTRGQHYHFKVEQTDGTIVLKVLGNSPLGSHGNQNAVALLKELGLAVNKQRMDFINALAHNHIPFRKEDLLKAFQLMDTAKQSDFSSLKQIMANRLPLTESILKAVEIAQDSTLSGEGKTLHSSMFQDGEATSARRVLADKLTWLLDPDAVSPKETLRHILYDVTKNRQHLFQQLHTSQIVPGNVRFNAWQSEWKQFMTTHHIHNPLHDHIPETAPRPFSFNEADAARALNGQDVYQLMNKISESQKLPIQARFLSHVQTMLQEAGLSHEFVAARNPETAETTIKSLLIQLIQQNHTISDRAQPLLNLINGLQMDSVQETSHSLQAMLQLPGEKMGLPEDMLLEFSGRKTSDGRIDSDDCTIVFHLNLTNMQTTMIDMHIQKRTVALTIWTESSVNDEAVHDLKPALTKGLKDLDYQLSSVKFKPIKQTDAKTKTSAGHNQDLSRLSSKGVDFRI